MLRTFINSDINVLNAFSRIYRFLPNENTIRPTTDILEQKQYIKNHIDNFWNSDKDYIKANVFNFETFINNLNKIDTIDKKEIDEWVFKECDFPYNTQSNHWILWKFSDTMQSFMINSDSINLINSIITQNIKNIIKSDNFDFGWYPNPKPSIPDFFHVHVFWNSF